MEVVCKGFTDVVERPGRCIGILPAEVSLVHRRYAREEHYPNPYVEIPIYTHLDRSGPQGLVLRSRNHINVLTSDAIVVLEGSDGTLSEAHLAVRYQKPVMALLSDMGRMPAIDPLRVRKTDRLEDVEAFIRAAKSSGPAPGFTPGQTELPAHFRAPDF
jgi:predicted Rossmann-fold nucleotide-binding protein